MTSMLMDVLMEPDALLCLQVAAMLGYRLKAHGYRSTAIRSTRGHWAQRRRGSKRSLASPKRRPRRKSSRSERRLMHAQSRSGLKLLSALPPFNISWTCSSPSGNCRRVLTFRGSNPEMHIFRLKNTLIRSTPRPCPAMC